MFDLDNTLYPHDLNLWQQVDDRIRDFVVEFPQGQPGRRVPVQKDYYRRYGTTMRGLMTEHGIEPDDFLEYVHEIDHSPLVAEPGAGRRHRAAARPQADPHQRHPRTRRRGDGAARASTGHFEDMFDIVGRRP